MDFRKEVKTLFKVTKEELKIMKYTLDVGSYLKDTSTQDYGCPMVKLGDVCEINQGCSIKLNDRTKGIIPYYGSSGIIDYLDTCQFNGKYIITGRVGTIGKFHLINGQFSLCDNAFKFKLLNDDNNLKYIYYFLKYSDNIICKSGPVPNINKDKFKKLKIPLPSLEIQQQIVDELDIHQTNINTIRLRLTQLAGEKKMCEKYGKISEIRELLNGCSMVALGDICEINNGTRIVKKNNTEGDYPVYGSGNASFTSTKFNRTGKNIVIGRFALSQKCVRLIDGKFYLNDSGITIVSKNDKLYHDYIALYLLFNQQYIYNLSRGQAQQNLDMDKFKKLKIPLPSLEVQQQLIAVYEQKQEAIDFLTAKIESEKLYLTQMENLAKDIISYNCQQ